MRGLIIVAVLAGSHAAHGEVLTADQVESAMETFEAVVTHAKLARAMNRPADLHAFARVFGVPFEYAGFDIDPGCSGWIGSGRIDDPAQLEQFASCASESLTIPMVADAWSQDLDRNRISAALRPRVAALARRSMLVVGEAVPDESTDARPRPGWVLVALHRTKQGQLLVDGILMSARDPIPLREVSAEVRKAIDTWLAIVHKLQATLPLHKDDCTRLERDIQAILDKPELAASKRVLRRAQLRAADRERVRSAEASLIEVAKTVCDGDLEARIGVTIDFLSG
jgi:hypothetical protein